MRPLLCVLAFFLSAIVASATVLVPKDLVGTWQAQREGTMLELHANSTYDIYYAEGLTQGRWLLRHHRILELSSHSKGEKEPYVDTFIITGYGNGLMSMHGRLYPSDVWKKVAYSRHLPRL